MAQWVYKAKKGIKETVEGAIEASSRQDALEKLAAQGLFAFVIEEGNGSVKLKESALNNNLVSPKEKVSSLNLFIFVQKMALLSRAKVDLLSSLKILYEQTENLRFRRVILELYNIVKGGKPFSEALSFFPRIFSVLFVNIIKTGEASGKLDVSFEQINEFMEREENLKRRVTLALAYPVLLLSVGLASIFILLNFVVPKLKPMFLGLGKELPLVTKIILELSSVSSRTWLWFTAGLAIFIWVLYNQKGSVFFRRLGYLLKSKLPLLRNITQGQELAHFSRSLALLLSSGVTVLRSLEIASLSIENKKLQEQLKKVQESVSCGENLAKSMGQLTDLPVFFIRMIAVGEESGRLSEVLREISKGYVQQVELGIALISSLLEPILILGMGIILGGIVLSILLPTFQITQFVQ